MQCYYISKLLTVYQMHETLLVISVDIHSHA